MCIQVDLQKHIFSEDECRELYNIVANANMLTNTIWEIHDNNFKNFSSLDKDLIYQLDDKWSFESIKRMKGYKSHANLIILSKWFPNFDMLDYQDIISFGHKNGFLMKCSIVNDSCVAEKLFEINVDLIVTDVLL